MPLLMLKDVPRFECLLQAAESFPELEPTASEAFLHLLHTGDAVFAAKSEFLAAHGLSQGRFSVLMLLNRRPDEAASPAELADEAAVTRATMTGLIDTLEKDELAVRETDPLDRRAVLVRLTKKGRALMRAVLPRFYRHVAEMMQPLGDSERKQLVRLLQKINRGLKPGNSARSARLAPAAV
jgi:DNA-binding MarR family transcriptional regulator